MGNAHLYQGVILIDNCSNQEYKLAGKVEKI
jgi:hypothetical protein